MKFLVDFSFYPGDSSSAVVQGSYDDIYDLMDQAAGYGAGYQVSISEME